LSLSNNDVIAISSFGFHTWRLMIAGRIQTFSFDQREYTLEMSRWQARRKMDRRFLLK
jgi:hypothetical protein